MPEQVPENEKPQEKPKDVPPMPVNEAPREVPREVYPSDNIEAEPPPDQKKDIMKQGIVAAVVAFVVFMAMGFLGIGGFVTVSDFDADILEMNTAVDSAVTDVNATKSAVDTQLAELTNTINSQVDTRVDNQVSSQIASATSGLNANVATLQGQISTLQGETSTLNSNVSTLTTDYAALQAKITTMEAAIEALETAGATSGGTTTGDAGVNVDMGYSQYFYWTSGNATVADQTLSMMIENNLSTAIKDVEIEVVIVTRGIPLNLQNDLCSVVGGYPLQFNKIHVGNGIVVIRGTTPAYGDGMEIGAGDSEYIYFTVNLGVPAESEPTSNITMYVSSTCKDYTVVE